MMGTIGGTTHRNKPWVLRHCTAFSIDAGTVSPASLDASTGFTDVRSVVKPMRTRRSRLYRKVNLTCFWACIPADVEVRMHFWNVKLFELFE